MSRISSLAAGLKADFERDETAMDAQFAAMAAKLQELGLPVRGRL